MADRIRERARAAGRNRPFPNHDSIWREITKLALDRFGVRLTSHYLRKRFHTIAGKTVMPRQLMGLPHGRQAIAWDTTQEPIRWRTLHDLINEYDRFLAPYLSIGETNEPDTPKDPIRSSCQYRRNRGASQTERRAKGSGHREQPNHAEAPSQTGLRRASALGRFSFGSISYSYPLNQPWEFLFPTHRANSERPHRRGRCNSGADTLGANRRLNVF